MTPYIGQFLLNLAALFALLPLVRSFSIQMIKRLYLTQITLIGIAFLWLIKSHLTSDFSLLNVIQHSHTQKPWLYKLAGTWGNHEGSILLWVTLMASYGLFAFKAQKDTATSQTRIILHSLLNFLFITFMLLACDPFAVTETRATEGRDLNPLLQDPLLAIHPPFLYAGYIGFCVSFIYVLSNIIHKNDISLWIPSLRKMILLPWTLLSIGLGLGSFWAYYELGWGGWWFWDPVENTALVPWVLGLMVIHNLIRSPDGALNYRQTVSFVILTFITSLGGTFLVRSGLLTSVHSFAVDPERGILLLGIILFILVGTVFVLYQSKKTDSPVLPFYLNTRADILRVAVIFAGAGILTVVFGTLYPLFSSALGYPITVGGPYFQMTFVPMMLPVIGMISLVPWLGWMDTPFKKTLEKVTPSLIFTGFTVVVFWYCGTVKTIKEILYFYAALWIVVSTLFSIKKNKISQRFIGVSLAHCGLGVAILGMVLSSANEQEVIKSLKVGEEIQVEKYTLKLESVETINGPNFIGQKAFVYLKNNKTKKILNPEKRFYWTQGIIHGETAIYSSLLDHFYIALGEQYENHFWSLKFYHKPFINLLWLGMIIIVMAGIILLKQKKKRFLNIVFLILALNAPSNAMEAHERLHDTVAETRAYHLGKMILCPTCAGQNINDSVADEALETRKEIRRLVLHGLSDNDILEHYIGLYGQRILYQPLFNLSNILLWGLPWFFFLCIVLYVLVFAERRGR